MLYDSKWGQPVNADPLTLESLIAWLEHQPAEELYCYSDTGRCLIARYLLDRGHTRILVGGITVNFDGRAMMRLPEGFSETAFKLPHTFGAALERARAWSIK